VNAYKQLANVERDFRSLKTVDLELRAIHHRLDDRIRGHILICTLAAYRLAPPTNLGAAVLHR
jgi:transposase